MNRKDGVIASQSILRIFRNHRKTYPTAYHTKYACKQVADQDPGDMSSSELTHSGQSHNRAFHDMALAR